eukprot:GFYU01007591.1.p1 GENE.GFYU01007591.1~~GFYU01007591.1.p1  ORF type:complete len:434 (-),score=81.61 GFYU01007591.1:114-1415(-)
MSKMKVQVQYADRFIPSRSGTDFDVGRLLLTMKENQHASGSKSERYQSILSEHLVGGQMASPSPKDKKLLEFKSPTPRTPKRKFPAGFDQSLPRTVRKAEEAAHRQVATSPERILDAPEMINDYYLNLLDWGSNNILAVALGNTVYLWNSDTGKVQKLMQTMAMDDYISSVQWMQTGNCLAIGTNTAEVHLWDAEKFSRIRVMRGHNARVSSLSWNDHILSSGSRDSYILHHDVRVMNHTVARLSGHTQEVCGLKWSPDGRQLASGGNDNLLNVYDGMSPMPIYSLDKHTAAVKALAWCPLERHLLASGGGTVDRHIRFWNTATGECTNSVDTASQVCSLQWAKHDKELVSSHGFSQNQLILWKYPTMEKIVELKGHESRVLHLTQSPDGQTVVSAAADETLRFWKVFRGATSKYGWNTKTAESLEGRSLRLR